MDYLYMDEFLRGLSVSREIPMWTIYGIDGLFTDPPFMDGEKTNWHQLVLCSAVIRYYITSCVELSILISSEDGRCRTCFNLTLFYLSFFFFFFFACWCDKL